MMNLLYTTPQLLNLLNTTLSLMNLLYQLYYTTPLITEPTIHYP